MENYRANVEFIKKDRDDWKAMFEKAQEEAKLIAKLRGIKGSRWD